MSNGKIAVDEFGTLVLKCQLPEPSKATAS